MQIVKLSLRLLAIANKVPADAKLADIGSDHALLPVYLAQKGQICTAVAGELNDGPYTSARSQVKEARLDDVIDVRQGDGLEVVKPGEVNTVVIAGMGGGLISSILEQGKEKLETVNRLILQPNVGEKIVRTWLVEHGWALKEEHLLQEDGVFYEIIVADRAAAAHDENDILFSPYIDECGNEMTKLLQMEMGPFLLRKREPMLVQKWQNELRKLDRIIENMGRSETIEAIDKRKQLESLYKQIEEVLSCLQKDKP